MNIETLLKNRKNMMKHIEYGDIMIKHIIISIVVVLLYITVCYGGDRRNIKTYDTGNKGPRGNAIVEHFTLLDPGECDNTGCVIFEHTTKGGLLYQWIDKDDDTVCDLIRVWKPLVDPTFGTFYTLHKYKLCRGSI